MSLRPLVPPPGSEPDWAALDKAFPGLAAELSSTPQDPRHHAEGDVWTHTRMVLRSLLSSGAYAGSSAADREILFAAALLHDAGKPARTKREPDGSISSRGHSSTGEGIARLRLWRLGMDRALREEACALIGMHQKPFFLAGKDRPDVEAVRLSLVLRPSLLAVLAEADARGRETSDPKAKMEAIENVGLFEMACKDAGAWEGSPSFPDAHSRRVWAKDPFGRAVGAAAFDDRAGRATLLCGMPGSGKDTWLRQNDPSLPVVSLDALRARSKGQDEGTILQDALSIAKGFLRSKTDFAWNSINLTREQRSRLVSLFEDYGFAVRIVHLEQPEAELRLRNRSRKASVPDAVMDRFLAKWQAPKADECHELVWAGNDARSAVLAPPCAGRER